MPIFIDEVVFRGEVVGPGADPSAAGGPAAAPATSIDRQALVDEVTQAVLDHLERALERIGER